MAETFLIVSDIHGDRDILETILATRGDDAEVIFYNGDSELSADDPIFDGVFTVAGNMDFDAGFAKENVVRAEDVTFFQTHGHLYDATNLLTWANLDKMAAAAKANGANVVLFGHTHKLGAQQHDGVLFINPGSTTIPKGKFANVGGTYATLRVEDDGAQTVEFFDRAGRVVPALTKRFTNEN